MSPYIGHLIPTAGKGSNQGVAIGRETKNELLLWLTSEKELFRPHLNPSNSPPRSNYSILKSFIEPLPSLCSTVASPYPVYVFNMLQ